MSHRVSVSESVPRPRALRDPRSAALAGDALSPSRCCRVLDSAVRYGRPTRGIWRSGCASPLPVSQPRSVLRARVLGWAVARWRRGRPWWPRCVAASRPSARPTSDSRIRRGRFPSSCSGTAIWAGWAMKSRCPRATCAITSTSAGSPCTAHRRTGENTSCRGRRKIRPSSYDRRGSRRLSRQLRWCVRAAPHTVGCCSCMPFGSLASYWTRPQVIYRHIEPGQQRPKSAITAEHIVEKLAKRNIELTSEQVRAAHSTASGLELPRANEPTCG